MSLIKPSPAHLSTRNGNLQAVRALTGTERRGQPSWMHRKEKHTEVSDPLLSLRDLSALASWEGRTQPHG